MKTIKKFLAVALAFLLILGAVSCSLFGNGSDSSGSGSKGSKKTKEATSESAEKTDSDSSGKKTAGRDTDDADTEDTDGSETDDKTEEKKTETKKTEEKKTGSGGGQSSAPSGAGSAIDKIINVYNMNSVSIAEYVDAATNGYLSSELKAFFKDIQKLDEYSDTEDDLRSAAQSSYDNLKDNCGADFRCYWIEDEVEKLDSEDIEEFLSDILDDVEELLDDLDDYDELDSEDIDELCETVGGTKSDIKKVYNDVKVILNALKKANITDGYSVSGYATVTGSKLDEPHKSSNTIDVYKINGVWVADMGFSEVLDQFFDLAEDLFYWSV